MKVRRSSWWLSTERMTVLVLVSPQGRIILVPPIVAKFMGQHINDLRLWMHRQPGYRER